MTFQILVCGHALEMNFTNDLDIFLSTNQVKLITDVMLQTMSKLSKSDDSEIIHEKFDGKDNSVNVSEPLIADSGIESDASTITARKVKDKRSDMTSNVHDLGSRSKAITPLDILLTASRISVISYTIKDIEQIEKVNEVTKMNLSEKPNLTKSASGKHEFIKLEVPAYESIHKDGRGHFSVCPFLYVYISQPHTVLSFHQLQQKFEMSCYDVLLKGSSTQTIHSGKLYYCEIIVNCGVLIFVDFVVHLNHEKSNEIQFSHLLLSVVFETTNSRTHGSMHFVEITKIGVNE